MSQLYFKAEKLETFCHDAFTKFGFNEEESRIITEVLIMSDKYGIACTSCTKLDCIIRTI